MFVALADEVVCIGVWVGHVDGNRLLAAVGKLFFGYHKTAADGVKHFLHRQLIADIGFQAHAVFVQRQE